MIKIETATITIGIMVLTGSVTDLSFVCSFLLTTLETRVQTSVYFYINIGKNSFFNVTSHVLAGNSPKFYA